MLAVGDWVLNSVDELNLIVQARYAMKTLYDLMSEDDLSTDNVSELEDVVNQLEMHENEVRRLRQSLSLRLRQQVIESYLEGPMKHTELIA